MSDFMTRVRDLGQLFWRNARESGEAAAEALEQRAAIQRLAGQVRKLDKERGELVRQIGGKVYALHGQGKVRNQDVLVDCQRIDVIWQEIAGLQQDIEKIRAASLEKGLEIPVLSDESGLTEEAETNGAEAVAPVAVEEAGAVVIELEAEVAAEAEESAETPPAATGGEPAAADESPDPQTSQS